MNTSLTSLSLSMFQPLGKEVINALKKNTTLQHLKAGISASKADVNDRLSIRQHTTTCYSFENNY